MKNKKILVVGMLCCALSAVAQEVAEKKSGKNKGVLSHFTIGGHLPGGDLAKRFGVSGQIGAGVEYLTPGNWLFGVEGAFHFGSKVKEDPLEILRTPEGDIIGNDLALATVRLQQRGMYVGVNVGKLITFQESRQGLRLNLSGGWMQHRIRAIDDARTVPQLSGGYKKGYDRQVGGPAIQEFIGWQNLGTGRELSWMAGIELLQGFTSTLRSWDFSSRQKLEGQRLDLRFGIKVAITLPFYTGNAEDIYY